MGKKTEQIVKYLPSVNKNYIWGGLIIIGAIVGIYYFGKNSGSFTPYILPNDTPPDDANPNDPNALTSSEQETVISISNALKAIIEGYFTIDYSAYNRMLTCSDRVFTGTYNFYSANFCTPPDTLRTKIESQRHWYLPFTTTDNWAAEILTRMDRLKLK